MTCHEFLERMDDLATGDADPTDAAALQIHAAGCPACAARLEETRALDARLKRLRETFAPRARLLDRVRAELARVASDAESGRADSPAPPSGPDVPTIQPWARLWRWAPAAAAALLIAAVGVLFFAGPGAAVPPLIADTMDAYEDLASGARALEIDTRDPKAVQDYFRKRLNYWLPPPGAVGSGAYVLKGGCSCMEAASGARIPCVVYERGGSLLALLVVDRSRVDRAFLDRGRKAGVQGRTVYLFTRKGVQVAICPCSSTVHLWVSRLPAAELLAAIQATPEGTLALSGIRISIEEMTCEMCCSGIREALARVPGVKDMAIDMRLGEVRILPGKPGLDVKEILGALQAAGYRAKPVADTKGEKP
jgi:copper chaperone CopZ/anti-sigma factor RsiW